MELYLDGVKLPPLGSIQDQILRAGLIRRNVRELRRVTISILSQGFLKSSEDVSNLQRVFREHSEDLLYNANKRFNEEKSLFEQYEEIRNSRPSIKKTKDGPVVTGL